MKKQAICIQCHTRPDIVNYLINCMPEENFDFYVHVDLKSNIYDEIVRRENVFFTDRVDVRWGQFSQVEATLTMFRMIDPDKYNYIHLISGSDFIVKSPEYIIDFFSDNDMEYIESNILDKNCTWSWHGEDRYSCYYPQWLIHRPKDRLFRMVRIVYREFIMRTKIFKRKCLPVSRFYGGSSWFSVTGECLQWMMQYLSNHPEYLNHFKHGICVDEVFFSTLVRYSPFEPKVANQHLRFMKWKGAKEGGPQIITVDDFEDMIVSEAIWARKFDSREIIELLDDRLNEEGC